MRHGIAVEPNEWDGPDETYPLTAKGKKLVLRAAMGLAALDCKPTHLFSSRFGRAYATARLLRAAIGSSVTVETHDDLAVGSTPERIAALLHRLPAVATVMCGGHEPLLGESAALLLCGKPMANFPLKNAGAACIHVPELVKPGGGQLRWWLEPLLAMPG